MTNNDDKGYNEITLSIALLGGIIVVLLKVIDYSNNQSLEVDSLSKPALYGLMIFLLIELLIIFLFFIFKGISVYTIEEPQTGTDNNSKKKNFEQIAGELFKISFIIAFMWIIASILTVSFKLITPTQGDLYEFVFSLFGYSLVVFGYSLILLITVFITVTTISTSKIIEILNKIIEKFKNSTTYLKFFFSLKFLIIFIILFVLFVSSFSLVSQYLLTGSYSIEEFSPSIDNPDIRTFTMKEKGISYNLTEVMLFKLNSSYPTISGDLRKDNIDNITAYRNIEKEKLKPSCYLWVTNFNTVWYLNIINISNLSSGTYLLHAEVRNDLNDNSVFGILKTTADKIGLSKRIAEKLFYIPPDKAKVNYSSKCNQTS